LDQKVLPFDCGVGPEELEGVERLQAYMKGGDTDRWVDVVIAEGCDLLDDLLGDTLSLLNPLKLATLPHDFWWIIIFIGLLVNRFQSGIRCGELHCFNQ
jgi:hypothetical protein